MHSTDAALEKAASNASNNKTAGKEKNDDIMSVLLAHEKQNTGKHSVNKNIAHNFLYVIYSATTIKQS